MLLKPIQIIRTLFLVTSLSIPFYEVHAAYPEKPIKIIIGFPAGGPLDAHIRLLSDKLQSILGQPVIVDYKAGAGGAVGARPYDDHARLSHRDVAGLAGVDVDVTHC